MSLLEVKTHMENGHDIWIEKDRQTISHFWQQQKLHTFSSHRPQVTRHTHRQRKAVQKEPQSHRNLKVIVCVLCVRMCKRVSALIWSWLIWIIFLSSVLWGRAGHSVTSAHLVLFHIRRHVVGHFWTDAYVHLNEISTSVVTWILKTSSASWLALRYEGWKFIYTVTRLRTV